MGNGPEIPVAEGLSEKMLEEAYGLTVDKAYKLAVACYREQERNGSIFPDYHQRLRFLALAKQAKYGSYKEGDVDYGWFDLVGNDVKKAWKSIGTALTQQQAMLEFIRLLDAVCPTFRTQIEQQKKQRKIEEAAEMHGNSENRSINAFLNSKATNNLLADHSPIESQEILQQFEQQRRQIQEALNNQTYHQFLAYAQQTHPGEPEKQEQLIKQLQEQHYQQYMSQVYAQARAASSSQSAATSTGTTSAPPNNNIHQQNGGGAAAVPMNQDPEAALMSAKSAKGGNQGVGSSSNDKIKSVDELAEEALEGADSDVSDEEDASETPANPKVAPASMWTAKNLQEFKETIKKDGPEGILKIGHGETVTVRVPTHPEGNSLFWEFCTDYYDLGFGVYFEWTIAENNQVTVQIDESGDEYDEEEAEGAGESVKTASGGSGDVEAEAVKKQQDSNKPRIDEIIPTFRRDCHDEVFFGSHVYPGRGVYLIKFDNSYSLWRSKTLYYRVFYSK